MISAQHQSDSTRPKPWTDWSVVAILGLAGLFLVAFANLINLATSDADAATGLDWQSLTKLGLIGLLGIYVLARLWVDPRLIPLLFTAPACWLMGIGLMLVLSSGVSSKPLVSLASGLSTVICILGSLAAGLHFGIQRAVRLVYWACVMFLTGSAAYWLVRPESAIFLEPLSHGEFSRRFAGLAHPNTIGQFSGLVILLTVLDWNSMRGKGWRWMGVAIVLLAVTSLMAALSRTSILALGLALVFAARRKLFRGIPLLAGLVAFGLLSSLLLVSNSWPGWGERWNARVIGLVSKSGEIDELTTGTGRNEIWAASLELIAARPWTGYGAATSKELLESHTRYTHNMFLNVCLSAGVLAGGLLLASFATALWRAWSTPIQVADGLVVFLFLNGLGENVCFLVIDSAPLILLVLALCWRPLLRISEANRQIESCSRLEAIDPLAGGLTP